jgi:hypothetical protein
MAIAIRIGIISVAMAVYMGWAFRGIEYEALEAAPDLLAFFLAFTIPTAIAVPVYKMLGQRDNAQISRFAFRFWLAAAGVAAGAWLVMNAGDPATAGFFRDNVIVGIIGLIALVAAVNFGAIQVLQYLAPKKR